MFFLPSTTIENVALGGKYSPANDGIVDSMLIAVAVSSASHFLHGAIYNVDNADTTLVDSTENIDVTTGTKWVKLDFIANATVYADSNYSLLMNGEATGGDILGYFSTNNTSCGGYWTYDASHTYAAWPTTKTDLTNGNTRDVSIRVWYHTIPEPEGPVNAHHSPEGAGQLSGINGASVLH